MQINKLVSIIVLALGVAAWALTQLASIYKDHAPWIGIVAGALMLFANRLPFIVEAPPPTPPPTATKDPSSPPPPSSPFGGFNQ